jgi:hypothetical protein
VPAKAARRLVIDASVAGAAGGKTATAPTSTNCRDFLRVVREEHYVVVMSAQLSREWDDHKSLFARTWLTAMTTRRAVIFLDIETSNKLRREIERVVAPSAKQLKAMRKDYHLLEAAMATDENVISLDEIVRGLFDVAALSVVALKNIVWVNPDKAVEKPIEWLEKNAKPERKRMLGFRAKKR